MTERETRAAGRETESRNGVNPQVFGGGGFCGFDGSASSALALIQLTVTETADKRPKVCLKPVRNASLLNLEYYTRPYKYYFTMSLTYKYSTGQFYNRKW